MDAIDGLKKSFLFRDFSAHELSLLSELALARDLPPQTTLCNEGDEGRDLYVVVLGTLQVLKQAGDDQEVIATLGSGATVGEIALVSDDHMRSATLETTEATRILALPLARLQKLFETDDRLGHRFYRTLATALARRLTATTNDTAFLKSRVLRHH